MIPLRNLLGYFSLLLVACTGGKGTNLPPTAVTGSAGADGTAGADGVAGAGGNGPSLPSTYPCQVATASAGAGNGGSSGLPTCQGVFLPLTKEECALHRRLYQPTTGLCVESCPLPEVTTADNECCLVGDQGLCCLHGRDARGECIPQGPGPGTGGGVPRCSSGQSYVCDSWGECHCS
ncbi:MAG: hypothetical protein RL033_1009 [Pseudomonadota bacterium]|jgi:hypothetical protein